jgi:hypothetical protein
MQGLRSRAGIVAMTAGAIALMSVPVVALAKGPPDAVGGGNDTAKSVVSPQANVPDTNRGQAKKPAPVAKPAPAPKPTPPGHAKRAVQRPAPAGGSGGGGNVSAPPRRAAKKAKTHAAPPAHAKAYGHKTPPGHAKHQPQEPAEGSSDPGSVDQPAPSGSPNKPSGSPDKPSRPKSPDELDATGPLDLPSADSPDSSDGDGGIPAAVVSETVELPENASPETLPFTGIQLGLLALIGLTSLVGGFALRRSAT